MRRLASLSFVLLWCLLAASASAQHSHPTGGPPGLVILHDVPDDGRTYVNNTVQFGYLVLEDGKPTVHKDGTLRILQNGLVMYETHGRASAHDYDGLNMVTVTFSRPGPYEVVAEVPVGSEVRSANFSGVVHPATPTAIQAELRLGLSGDTVPMCNAPIAAGVYAPDGSIVNHSDVLVEVRKASTGALEFRTHLHTHREPVDFAYSFRESGAYDLRVVAYQAYPTKSATEFSTVEVVRRVTVTGNGPCPSTASGGSPEGSSAASGPYELLPTFDPEATVHPNGAIRLNGVVLDAVERVPVAHVDFSATLRRTGTAPMLPPESSAVFSSESLHEYDGVFSLDAAGLPAGQYALELTARKGNWTQTITMPFKVDPVGLPLAAGPGIVDVAGLAGAQSWAAQSVELRLRTAAGTPIMHAEVDFEIVRKGAAGPVVQNKLHTHGDGVMGFDVLLTEPGEYSLRLDPTTLEGEPVTSWDANGLGQGRLVEFTVAPGTQPDAARFVEPSETVPPPETTPAPPVAWLVLCVLAILVLRRGRVQA